MRRVFFILTCLSLHLFSTFPAVAQLSYRRADETSIELELESRLESVLSNLIGPGRAIVQVDITLFQETGWEDVVEQRKLRGLPGIATPKLSRDEMKGQIALAKQKKRLAALLVPTISSLSVFVLVDKSLSEEKIDLIKNAINQWARLDAEEGDKLIIKQIPWKDVPAETIGAKGFKLGLRAIYLIMFVSILLFALVFIVTLYMRSLVKKTFAGGAGGPGGPGDEEVMPGALAEPGAPGGGGAEDAGAGGAGGAGGGGAGGISIGAPGAPVPGMPTEHYDSVMEELKTTIEHGLSEAISKISDLQEIGLPTTITSGTVGAPRTEEILEEIKDILAAGGGAAAPKAGLEAAVAAAAEAGAGAAAPTGAEAAAPGAAGAGAGPGGAEAAGFASEEVVKSLSNIQDLLQQQVEEAMVTEAIEKPFKFLNSLPPKEIHKIIKGEAAKISATILVHINPAKTAEVLALLDEDERLEVTVMIAGIEESGDEAVEEIKEFLKKKLETVALHPDFAPVTGSSVLAKVLSSSSSRITQVLLEKLGKEDQRLANEVRKKLFLFEDIVTLDERSIEDILTKADRNMLRISLKGAPEDVRQRFFDTMTERAAAIFREDIDVMKQVNSEQAESAQQEILKTIRELRETGTVTLPEEVIL